MTYALPRQRHALVHLGHVGDADGAARAHDDVQVFREGRAQAELRDRLLVAAADVHDRDGERPISAVSSGDRLREAARQRRVAELQLPDRSGVRVGAARPSPPRVPSISPRTSAAIRSSFGASASSVS